jgi:hypothetical protein
MIATYDHRIDIRLNPQAQIGPYTIDFIRALWAPFTTEAFKQERRLLHLLRDFPAHRFEAACRRALFYDRSPDIELLQIILHHRLERMPLDPATDIHGQFLLDLSI